MMRLYGSEKAYNALRLAITLQKGHAGADLRIFLMADAVKPHRKATTASSAC